MSSCCMVRGCRRPHKARGYCAAHYLAKRRAGLLPPTSTAGRPLEGRTFGRLTVIGPPEWRTFKSGKRVRLERCRCQCGTETSVYRTNLISGKSTSCGCLTLERSIEAHRAMRREMVSYIRVHMRLKEDVGPASNFQCPCGAPADEWAYDHEDPSPLLNERGLLYSLDPAHYIPMCRRCHRDLDRRMREASA
jgi:hypothetical protein